MRDDIRSDGSRIEGSHKGWNSLQRSFCSGLELQLALSHDFVLRRNTRVAFSNGETSNQVPFLRTTFGSHHVRLVNNNAAVFNGLLPVEPYASKAGGNRLAHLSPLPLLRPAASGETFGLVNSEHADSFGGLLSMKEEPDCDYDKLQNLLDGVEDRHDSDTDEHDPTAIIRAGEVGLDPALFPVSSMPSTKHSSTQSEKPTLCDPLAPFARTSCVGASQAACCSTAAQSSFKTSGPSASGGACQSDPIHIDLEATNSAGIAVSHLVSSNSVQCPKLNVDLFSRTRRHPTSRRSHHH